MSSYTDPGVWHTILADEARAITHRQTARAVLTEPGVAEEGGLLGAPAPTRFEIARDVMRDYGAVLLRFMLAMLGVALAVAAVLRRDTTLAFTEAAYIVSLGVIAWRWSHRERQDTHEHFGRVQEQLFRVRSTLEP